MWTDVCYDMLIKDKRMNMMNAVYISSMLQSGATGRCSSGFIHRNITNNLEAMNNSNRYPMGSHSCVTAFMNWENQVRDRACREHGDRGVLQQKPGPQINSTRYKTELCRPFEESGSCKYGEKCQFAHGYDELRSLTRHPKYKTEPCRTFHTIGFCPYGPRCHFIHNADEQRPAASDHADGSGRKEVPPQQFAETQRDRPGLHNSTSCPSTGFFTHHEPQTSLLESPKSRTPPPPIMASCCTPTSVYDILTPESYVHFACPQQGMKSSLPPLAVHTPREDDNSSCPGASYRSMLDSARLLSASQVCESPPSPDSLSDQESCASGSSSSSGSSRSGCRRMFFKLDQTLDFR